VADNLHFWTICLAQGAPAQSVGIGKSSSAIYTLRAIVGDVAVNIAGAVFTATAVKDMVPGQWYSYFVLTEGKEVVIHQLRLEGLGGNDLLVACANPASGGQSVLTVISEAT